MRNNFSQSHSSIVKSAARTLEIIELLVESPNGLTLTEISKKLVIPFSSLHNLLSTLMHKGYVIRDESSLLYRPGSKISKLVAGYHHHADMILIADPYMQKITQLTGETTSLSILIEDEIVFVFKKAGKGIVQVVNPVGTRLPAHATGSGKVMLAYLSDDEIGRIYPDEHLLSVTPNTISSKKELIQSLDVARQMNYAYDDEESCIGVWAVASCILNQEQVPVAAISIVVPKTRLNGKVCLGWHNLVKEAAVEISGNFAFRP